MQDIVKKTTRVVGKKIVYDYSKRLVYSSGVLALSLLTKELVIIAAPALFTIHNLERLINLKVNPEIASAGYLYDKANKFGIVDKVNEIVNKPKKKNYKKLIHHYQDYK